MNSRSDVGVILIGFSLGFVASYSLWITSKTYQYNNHVEGDRDRNVIDQSPNSTSGGKNCPNEIKNELLSRVKSFFGDSFCKIEDAFVIVVGLGGVGSHATNMIVRSGVGHVRLIDFDQVSLSSLNRHAVATLGDVGISKAEVMKKRLLEIVPWCKIAAVTEMFRASEAGKLLEGKPTFVLDCIDDVSTKADLISYCLKNGLKVLTSMGAGGKADPTRLRIAPLSECINDPLASKIKWKLKKHGVNADDVMSLFSIEKPVCDLLPLDDDQVAAPQDFGAVDYMRVRVVPVLGTSPSIFGHAMASYVLCTIAGKGYEPETCERLSKKLKHKMRQALRNNEMRRFKTIEELDVDEDGDLDFVISQVWRSRCAVTGRKFGGHSPLVLTRWRSNEPSTPYNLVLLMPGQAAIYEAIASGSSTVPGAAQQIISTTSKDSDTMAPKEINSEDGDVQFEPAHKKPGSQVKSISQASIDKINARLAWAKTVYDDYEKKLFDEVGMINSRHLASSKGSIRVTGDVNRLKAKDVGFHDGGGLFVHASISLVSLLVGFFISSHFSLLQR